MATTVEATDLDRYIELHALELVATSSLALGQVFGEHLKAINLEDGWNIAPYDRGRDLRDLFDEYVPDRPSETDADRLIQARGDLLIARLLRSITPELIEESATYYEALAARKLAQIGGDDRDA